MRYYQEVTELVDFGINDDEALPLTKCVCGKTFGNWEQIVGIYPEIPWECPECGARLHFEVSIRVWKEER